MFQNAGEKGIPHRDPLDPPRRRANNRRGHGTFENDRPPIVGTVGRESNEVRLEVVRHTDKPTLHACVKAMTEPGSLVHTDEWKAYVGLDAELGREHKTVVHSRESKEEWARDDDGDGIREVHTNTAEGFWQGLRNFLRRFRGVSKWHLHGYVRVYEMTYNLRRLADWPLDRFLRVSTVSQS